MRIVHLKWPGPFPLQSTIRRVCHRVRRNHLARRNSTQNWTLLKACDWFLSKRIFANLCHPLPLPILTCKSSECSFGEMSQLLTYCISLPSWGSPRSWSSNPTHPGVAATWFETNCTRDPWWAVSWASDCFCNLANSSAAGFPPEKPRRQDTRV